MKIIAKDNTYRVFKSQSGERLRVALLCSDDPQHTYLMAELARRFHLVGAIVEPSHLQQTRLLKRRKYIDWLARYYQGKRQKYTGRSTYRTRYFAALGDEAPSSVAELRGEERAGARQPLATVETLEVATVNGRKALERMEALRPDVTIVCGTMFIGRKMIERSGLIINIHGGYLPDYKGNHCVFFAYARGDFAKIGATLHLVSLELDGGDVIEVVRPPVFPHDNDEHLYCRAVHVAMLRLFDILAEFQDRGHVIAPTRQPDDGTMYYHRTRTPQRELGLWLRRCLGRHPVPHLPVHDGDRSTSTSTSTGAMPAAGRRAAGGMGR